VSLALDRLSWLAGARQGGSNLRSNGAHPSRYPDVRRDVSQLGHPLRTGASRIPADEPRFKVAPDRPAAATLLVDGLHGGRWITFRELESTVSEGPPGQGIGI